MPSSNATSTAQSSRAAASASALRSYLLGSAIAVLLTSPAAFAGNTWDGGGGSGLWNTDANWDGDTPPSTGTALTFAGNVQNSTSNDLVAVDPSFAGILFTNNNSAGNTSGFTLAGSRITLGGDITTTALTVNGTITDIISLNMILNGNRIITTNQGSTARLHNLTISGIINEDVAGRTLTKAGGANTILFLSNANTYTGSTTINGGRLELNHLNAIQFSSSVSVASGTSLQLNVAGTYGNTSAIALVGVGAAGQANPGALSFGSGGATDSTLNAAITLGGATTISSYGVTMNQTLGGAIGGTGPLTIDSRGGGVGHTATWTLNAASNYAGNTTILTDDGLTDVTVKLGIANALPTTTSLNLRGATGQAVAVFSTLDLNGFSQQLAGLTDTTSSQSNGSFTVGKRVINSSGTLSTLTLDIASGNNTYGTTGTRVLAGTIGGTTAGNVAANNLALTKTGAGDLTLNGANTYTGDTTISNGRIWASTAANLSSGATTIIQSGTGQLFTNAATGITFSNNFNISTLGYLEAGDPSVVDGAIRSDGNNIFSGIITLSGNSRIGAFGNAKVNTISGQITGNFAMSFYGLNGAINDTQTYIISNTANNYTGDTQIDNKDYDAAKTGNSTTLRLGASDVIPNVALGGNVVFGGVDANSLTILDLYGFNDTINGLTAANAAGARITNTAAAANSVLQIGANDTTSSFSGTITDSGVGRTLAITKIGNGTLTLSGTNTYTGPTTVSQGTLLVNNPTGSGSGLVTVSAGATLGGTGTIAGNTTISGTHSPGNYYTHTFGSPDIQTFGGKLTYEAESNVIWELVANSTAGRGTSFDGINVGTDLSFNGATTLRLNFDFEDSAVEWSNTFWASDYTETAGWLVYSGATSLTGFENLALNAPSFWLDESGDTLASARSGASFSLYQDGSNIYLNYIAVPEPASAGLLLIGGLALRALSRRRSLRRRAD